MARITHTANPAPTAKKMKVIPMEPTVKTKLSIQDRCLLKENSKCTKAMGKYHLPVAIAKPRLEAELQETSPAFCWLHVLKATVPLLKYTKANLSKIGIFTLYYPLL
jgi:hypothetical protein